MVLEIINTSIHEADVPEVLKEICKQLTEYSESTGMTEHLQSAYKANNSTETALLKVREDILQAIDHREVTCLVLLDLSAAFDTVDHQLLLNRLKHRFGVVGKHMTG